jgi:ADP-ribosylglycohydrolase
MPLPPDYLERVYAGVLGKIIGVYLGRPFEGWTYDRIMADLGEIWYYVHERKNVPLIVTDDDISGTFTFLRALPDYGNRRNLTPAQIGQSWLNYMIEGRTILWWGGMGNSTEHTAYLRLKQGISAPHSGSQALNGKVVAEQIGAQIFIDGWAMVAPGDPELAADLARRAASVSHDGEAIYGAQVIAAMEAQAFVEHDLQNLIDTALRLIPSNSIIYRLVNEIREWHAAEPDWRKNREQIAAFYGYDKYGGNCHMIPNHALIINALLHGDDDFQKSLMIVNTCGWDTDCNSGNVGCLLGIKNGLAGIDAGPDWRGPVADRMYLATADGGRAITDAATEAVHIVNSGRALAGEAPIAPKQGARFHFELPGSVQGFMADDSPAVRGTVTVENVAGHGQSAQKTTGRSLALRYAGLAPGRWARVQTPTFIPSKQVGDYFLKRGYALLASPTLHGGQTVTAALAADAQNSAPVCANLHVTVYGHTDELYCLGGPQVELQPGQEQVLTWQIPNTDGSPIAAVGVELHEQDGSGNGGRTSEGVVYLDYLTWSGAPDVAFVAPPGEGIMWRRAWVNGVDQFEDRWWGDAYRLVQNSGRGLLMQGSREWTDYRVSGAINLHMVEAGGIAARVQGMRRGSEQQPSKAQAGTACLIKALDGDTVLAETEFAWEFGETHAFTLEVAGNAITGVIDGRTLFTVTDDDHPLTGGGVAFVVEEGRVMSEGLEIRPLA